MMRWLAFTGGFFLTLQTVWILRPGTLGGVPWPLATIGIFVGDAVLFTAAMMGIMRWVAGAPPPLAPPPGGRGGNENDFSRSPVSGTPLRGGQQRGSDASREAPRVKWEWGSRSRRLHVISFAMLIVVAIINIRVSADPWLSAVGWARIIMLLLAVASIPLWSASARRAFLGGFLVAMLGHTILGFLQFATGHGFASTFLGTAAHDAFVRGDAVVETVTGRWLRAYGGFSHPNVFGASLLAAMAIVAQHVWNKRRQRTVFAILTVALVLTFSRATFLGFIILLAILAWRRGSRRLAVVGVASLVVAVAVTWPLWVPRVTATGQIEQRSFNERRAALSDARALIVRQPWFGVGLHAVPEAIMYAHPDRAPYTAQPVHSVPLLAFVEIGIFGISALPLVMVLLFRRRSLSIGHCPLGILLPSLLLDHALWSLPIGLLLMFALVMSASLDTDRTET